MNIKLFIEGSPEELANVLQALQGQKVEVKTETQQTKKPNFEKKEEKPTTQPLDFGENSETSKTVSLSELKELGGKVREAGKSKQMKEWLTSKGAKTLSTLSEEFFVDCKEFMVKLAE